MPVSLRLTPLAAALSCSLCALAAPIAARADDAAPASAPVQLHEVEVTGQLGSDLVGSVAPAASLEGDDLVRQRGSTLGETMRDMVGVSQTQYGPNVSRPVVRGMDGDRVKILANGGASLDASALSYDHAVPLDPLGIERIELIRGPAALLYGPNVLGGVVNVVGNQIPRESIQGVSGAAEMQFGAADARAGSAMVEAGDGDVAVHVEGFTRSTSDLRIPGFARSGLLRGEGPPEGGVEASGRLPNSSGRESGGTVGLSRTWGTGYLGASYTGYDSNYGTVAELDSRIQMHQNRVALAGEQRGLDGFVTRVSGKLDYSDYIHRELDGGEVGTTFRNSGWSGRLEADHARLGPLSGTFGAEFAQNDFSALGEEAFVPKTSTDMAALFVLEDVALGASDRLHLHLGGRVERDTVRAEAGGSDRFSDASRGFTPASASAQLAYKLAPAYTLTGTLAYTQRAPTFYELYANGPHMATGTYEIGDGNAQMETSTSLDVGMHFDSGDTHAQVSAYYADFGNYLALAATGRVRDESGNVVAPGADGALPEYRYLGVPARLYGLEAQARAPVARRLFTAADTLSLIGRLDVVRGDDRDSGQPLPRLAPWRAGTSLVYDDGPWHARTDLDFVAAQTRVPADDTPTAGYVMWGLMVSYDFRWGHTRSMAYLRGDNLTNQEARNAVSVLRDISPLGGRAVTAGIRTAF